MTKEIKAGSKLLAGFEGWDESPYPNLPDKMYRKNEDGIEVGLHIDQLTYHTDYNDLMRVWRKFRDLITIIPKNHLVTYDDFLRRFSTRLLNFDTPMEAFSLLVEAVTWYNSLKSKS